jgi:hypothetical protein
LVRIFLGCEVRLKSRTGCNDPVLITSWHSGYVQTLTKQHGFFRQLAHHHPTSRTLAVRSASTSSSRLRSIDDRLAEFFPKSRDVPFTDADLNQISLLLHNGGRLSHSQVPRIYSVLRVIDRLEFLDEFIQGRATDLYFSWVKRYIKFHGLELVAVKDCQITLGFTYRLVKANSTATPLCDKIECMILSQYRPCLLID